jgi:membrane protease YdiL (CAAX protease family)
MSDPVYTLPESPLPPVPATHKVFYGRFGLRAGWSIVIFLLFAAIIMTFSGIFAVGVSGHGKEYMAAREVAKAHPNAPKPIVSLPFNPQLVIVQDGVIFSGFLLLCFVLSRAERRRLGAYGIGSTPTGSTRIGDVIPGALWGIVSMSCLVAILRWRGLLVFDSQALHGSAIFTYGLAWLFAFALVGFAEEYEFRGYLQFTLMRGCWGLGERLSPRNPQPFAFWIAALIMSFAFGAVHMLNGGETLIGLLQVVFIGLAFSYALWRTGSLWWGIGFHALWDFMQSFTFGVADSGNVSVGRLFNTHAVGKPLLSGGSDGPEGSLYAVLFVALTFVAVRLTAKPGAYAQPEQLPLHHESLPPLTPEVIA